MLYVCEENKLRLFDKYRMIFVYQKESTEDIGLYRIDRDAMIDVGRLQPICLPMSFDKSDVVQPNGDKQFVVYTSGWGRLFSACVTDEFGPVKELKCKFPFTYKDKTLLGCSTSRTPSKKDEDCNKMWKEMRAVYPTNPGDVISLFIESKNVSKSCYSMSAEGGWCQGVGTNDEDNNDNWGWCKDHCKYQKGTLEQEQNILPTRLQETKLNVLPMAHCRNLVKAGGYQFLGRYDMCAGRKKKFKTIQKYKLTRDEKYDHDGNVTNYFGLNEYGNYSLDYYIGGTDSCSGDSGGGLYYWKDGVPILLGVVSRGYGSDNSNGCGELNFPGIYTRVTRYLEWIYTN